MKLVLATGNAGKVRELAGQLAASGVTVVARTEFTPDEPAEDGLSFVENALIKARHAAEASGLPAVADDSGLRVAALQGAPGVHSARYAGDSASDADNWRKLLDELRGVAPPQRRAAFHCTLVFLRSATDPAPIIASAEWTGSIRLSPAGEGGFGYDPVFQPDGLDRCAAELAPDEKQAVSHRARALSLFLPQLRHVVSL
ncbi:MAG: RdgB/HAM1 family non-canonical purine NTP pyrophosphatase [Pseudomonadota bacterium]